MDTIQLNKMIDAQINNGVVTSDALQRFLKAYEYDAATSVTWLINRLKLIRITLTKRPVTIDSTPVIIINNENEFKDWGCKYFPEILDDILE